MRPLYADPSMEPGNEASLTGLLVDMAPFKIQFIERQVFSGGIRSKGNKLLPLELWFQILDELRSDVGPVELGFMICTKISSEAKGSGESKIILTCHLATPHDGWNFGKLDSCEKVYHGQSWLSDPLEHKSIWRLEPDGEYQFELKERGSHTQPFVYECLSVPDIIARIEGGNCDICGGTRTVFPGFIGSVAQNFDAVMPRRAELICPLCIGINEMYEDKKWHRLYPYGVPERQQKSRYEIWNAWLAALGYDLRFELDWEEHDYNEDYEDYC